MASNAYDPRKLAETEFAGELQEFCGPALAPNDPQLEPRERRGRPASPFRVPESEEGNEPSNRPD
jgi:hypothetical protein